MSDYLKGVYQRDPYHSGCECFILLSGSHGYYWRRLEGGGYPFSWSDKQFEEFKGKAFERFYLPEEFLL